MCAFYCTNTIPSTFYYGEFLDQAAIMKYVSEKLIFIVSPSCTYYVCLLLSCYFFLYLKTAYLLSKKWIVRCIE